jgi:hypothetical protein
MTARIRANLSSLILRGLLGRVGSGLARWARPALYTLHHGHHGIDYRLGHVGRF